MASRYLTREPVERVGQQIVRGDVTPGGSLPRPGGELIN
jgi:hypothetical protein